MTAAELAAIAVLCISPALDDEPSKMTVIHKLPAICIEALKPAPPRIKSVSRLIIVAPKPRKKLADRCGSMTAVWYVRKDGHRKYRCK